MLLNTVKAVGFKVLHNKKNKLGLPNHKNNEME